MSVTLFTSETPEFNAANNPAGKHALGMRFTCSLSGYQVNAMRFWVPASGIGVLTTAALQLWNETGGTKLTEVNLLLEPTPSANDWMTVTLSSPIVLSTSVTYIVCSYTDGSPGEYAYTNTGSFPLTHSPLSASTAIYRNGGNSTDIPNTTFGGYFFADVTVDVSTIEGTGALTGSSGSLSGTGTSINAGTGALTSTTGALSGAGGSTNSGTGALTGSAGVLAGTGAVGVLGPALYEIGPPQAAWTAGRPRGG